MRMQQPHTSQRDVVPADCDDGTAGAFFPGRGLCCPEDPLDLVLQLFPADRAPPPSSLAALGIGGAGEPPRPVKEVPKSPKPLAESAYGGGGGGVWDSWGLSSFVLDGLCGLDEIDVDMFFADDALDGGGEATQGNLLCDPTADTAKPKPAAHITAGGPAHVHTRGSSGGPNDAAPLPAPMPAGAFPLQAYDACHAFDAAVFNNASAAPAVAPMPAGGPPPVLVTNNNSTPPPLPALILPAAPVPMPAGGPQPVCLTNNSTPPLPALIMPAAPVPMPAGGPQPVRVTNNSTPTLPALMPAAPALMPPADGLHACAALPGIVSNGLPAPPPLMPPMPARALHPYAAALAGVYSSINIAPARAPPSATPSSSPPSGASSGSGRCPSSSTTSEPEFLQPHHAWVVPRKQRSPPAVNRRKRPWLLDFPLHALPQVALPPPVNPGGGDDDDDDAKNRNALVPAVALAALPVNTVNTGGDDIAAGSGSGGIRRRRPAPRQRNRQAQRVCSHCHSPETPQWRAGPDGPGTLCNACGIRYAANRLLPEYRPSTAPSFRSGLHSNRHRKVMKLREQTKAAATEEKPSSEQAMEDDGTKMEKDDGFMGVCEYISAAGLWQ